MNAEATARARLRPGLRGHVLTGTARVWLLIAGIWLVTGAAWGSVVAFDHPARALATPVLPWWAIAGMAFLTEAYVVHIHFRRQAHTLSLNEIVVVLGLFNGTPRALLIGQALGTAVALAACRRQRPMKLLFNVGQLLLGTAIAVLLFRAVVGAETLYGLRVWATALAAICVMSLVGVTLVAVVIFLAEREWSLSEYPRTLMIAVAGATATGSLALAAVELLHTTRSAVLLLVLPVVLCGLALRAYVEQRQEAERVRFLYESMRRTQEAPEFGLAVGQLLLAARQLLRAEYAEIVLPSPRTQEGALRSTSGPQGETLMRPVPLQQTDHHALRILSSSSAAVVLARGRSPHSLDGLLAARGLEDAIVGVLRTEAQALGLILVGDRAGDVATFTSDDLGVFETFAGHASVLLENGRLERSLAQVTELQEALQHQAYHDGLTGLPNRLLFAERVADALEAVRTPGQPAAMLFLDLDGFKVVNDTLGHASGDELLVEVARRLKATVRPQDIPARLGGDEFAVLLDETEAPRAEAVAARIASVLGEPYRIGRRLTTVHVSIGIALAQPDMRSPDELFAQADLAMYSAKSERSRRFATYEPGLHEAMRQRHALAFDLEEALKRREIVVYYQPAVSISTGRIHAFEALARWRHPSRGLVLPDDFLPTAAESGIMEELGRFVVDEACRQAGRWQEITTDHGGTGLWLNLSPTELQRDTLVDELSRALTRTRLDARLVSLEVTEASVVQDETRVARLMRDLRDLGFSISIDDFGTGYSSLSRLRDFPIDMLKIPKPFVDRLARDGVDASLVDAILRLAGSLGLTAVAEGIETAEQAERLRALGCDLAQGFFFGHPVTGDEALHTLRRNQLRRVTPVARAS